jgi:hypothetical protein
MNSVKFEDRPGKNSVRFVADHCQSDIKLTADLTG